MARRTGRPPGNFARPPLAGRRCTGAMLLLVMFIVAVIGILLSVAGPVWYTERQRDKEAELLWRGEQYAHALAGYYAASPGPARQYPQQLEQLLLDQRQPNTVRHLRRLYRDPFTGRKEWGLIKDGSGGITGVYSLGKGVPLKQAGFDKSKAKFTGAKSYADWTFIADPGNTAASPAPAPGPASNQPTVPSAPVPSAPAPTTP